MTREQVVARLAAWADELDRNMDIAVMPADVEAIRAAVELLRAEQKTQRSLLEGSDDAASDSQAA